MLSAAAEPPAYPYAHQAELLFRLSFRRPIRVFIGDEIGLGKTVEAILAVRLLERRGEVKKVLLLVPRILVEQWRSELKRFDIPARVIERKNLQALAREGFPSGWYIASIDLVKREEHAERMLVSDWDAVIVDEAHKVGIVRSGTKRPSLRYQLVEELAKNPSRHLLLLSATPHRGDPEDYVFRLKLIDPYISASYRELDDDRFYRLTRNSIVFRRTKDDVNRLYEKREVFKGAKFIARVIPATREEVEFNDLLLRFIRDKLTEFYEYAGEEPKSLPLLLAVVAKRASSSPFAAMKTMEKIIQGRSLIMRGAAQSLQEARRMLEEEAESIVEEYMGLGFEDYEEQREPDELINEFAERGSAILDERDMDTLQKLFKLASSISGELDSRLNGIIKLIGEHINAGDRVVVFTEYKDTAKYLRDEVFKRLPELKNELAFITSEEIVIPGWSKSTGPDIEDVKRYLREGRIRLIISTDVAAEGLNLQAANVIVNYEPTWSPVKIEQRIGRVWRLGQEKEVVSYTVFLAIQSDRDVLDVLYRKLLAWGRTLHESRVSIGEEITIDFAGREGSTAMPFEPRRGMPSYSEYTAILRYLREGRASLERYVADIINALEALRENLERVGLARQQNEAKIEAILKEDLGDLRGNEAAETLKGLLVRLAELRGISVKVKGQKVYAGEKYIAQNINDYYMDALHLSEGHEFNGPINLVSKAQIGLSELHLFKEALYFGGRPVFSDVVGIGIKQGSPVEIRGTELLKDLSEALSPENVLAVVDEYNLPELLKKNLELLAESAVKEVPRRVVDEFLGYIIGLERLNLSSEHSNWSPRDANEIMPGVPERLGTIIFISHAEGVTPPTPADVARIEEEAMKIAIDYETSSGRAPEDVHMHEHYDIRSVNKATGEVRFIEVKGKSGFDLEVELTETEFQFAKENSDRYWLYIVYGIGTGKPRLLAIKDPVNSVAWEERSIKRYRFVPT